MAVTVDDVESLANNGWQSLTDGKKQNLLDDAERERATIFSGRVSRTPTLQGDEDIFIKNLAAHKYELAEGGEEQSTSQTGGNTSYNVANPEGYLTLTRYGQTCLTHLDDRQSIGIVRSWD
jgi:hypothetical protein